MCKKIYNKNDVCLSYADVDWFWNECILFWKKNVIIQTKRMIESQNV